MICETYQWHISTYLYFVYFCTIEMFGVFMEEKKKKRKKFLEKPLYPGGAKALREFVNAHLQYPQDAIDQHIEGVVTITYQVNDDGEVERASVPPVTTRHCASCKCFAMKRSATVVSASR